MEGHSRIVDFLSPLRRAGFRWAFELPDDLLGSRKRNCELSVSSLALFDLCNGKGRLRWRHIFKRAERQLLISWHFSGIRYGFETFEHENSVIAPEHGLLLLGENRIRELLTGQQLSMRLLLDVIQPLSRSARRVRCRLDCLFLLLVRLVRRKRLGGRTVVLELAVLVLSMGRLAIVVEVGGRNGLLVLPLRRLMVHLHVRMLEVGGRRRALWLWVVVVGRLCLPVVLVLLLHSKYL